MRQPDFFEKNHPNRLRYTFLDVVRVAQNLGIPFMAPRPTRLSRTMTREIAADQPYIRRITRLGAGGGAAGTGAGFADEASRLIWGRTENWRGRAPCGRAGGRGSIWPELDAGPWPRPMPRWRNRREP